jgi:hypothetical protein
MSYSKDGTEMDTLLTMSKKELTRLEVLKQVEEKRLKQREAVEIIKVSERHIRRLLKWYRRSGAEGWSQKGEANRATTN